MGDGFVLKRWTENLGRQTIELNSRNDAEWGRKKENMLFLNIELAMLVLWSCPPSDAVPVSKKKTNTVMWTTAFSSVKCKLSYFLNFLLGRWVASSSLVWQTNLESWEIWNDMMFLNITVKARVIFWLLLKSKPWNVILENVIVHNRKNNKLNPRRRPDSVGGWWLWNWWKRKCAAAAAALKQGWGGESS